MTKQELYNAVKLESSFAEAKLIELIALKEKTISEIDYWSGQVDSCRSLCFRLSIEISREEREAIK